MHFGGDICTDSIGNRKRGRPRRSIAETTVLRIMVRLKAKDVRNLRRIINKTGIENRAEIMRQALRVYAETLGIYAE